MDRPNARVPATRSADRSPPDAKNRPLQRVATLGPASFHLVSELRKAGATSFRLNASHMSAAELSAAARAARRSEPRIPLVIDLQGAKTRLGRFEARPVRAGDRIRFEIRGSGDGVPLPHPEVFAAARAGDTLGSDDSRFRFRVGAATAETIEAVALTDGVLRPRKGINLVEHPVLLTDLIVADLEAVSAVADLTGLAFAISFMKDGSEAEWLRRRAPERRVIGKVERREATASTEFLAASVDELWICRGDLGTQLGPGLMARWIAQLDPRRVRCPVLMAGQVLEHLTHHPLPTRSEVCHLYDLAQRGYAGFVLSDETAIGSDPVRAVRTLRDLCSEFET